MIDQDLAARVAAWQADDPDPTTRSELERLLNAGDEAGLRDRFDASLAFGTAGLRGALGAGPNRMNRVVVRRTAAALAHWLDANQVVGPVVVGRDARHNSDVFAADTAAVMAATGRAVVVIPDVVPTPVLAYAVLALGAVAGVMVTASHNPPEDNGYKIYAADGAQIIPPVDAEIEAIMATIETVAPLPMAPADDARITALPAAVVTAYLDGVTALRRVPDAPQIKVAYTPMHGVGWVTVQAAFAAAGLDPVLVVAEQAAPDPDFPTVRFPNPEEPGAMDLLLALAAAEDVDLALANDPDADRLAVAVPDAGGWRALSGDEIGILLADHLLRHDTGADRLVATTVVSSTMLAALAADHGVEYAETLTGFKWLAHASMARPDRRFVVGYEEALGYSVGELVRDKDGVSAAVIFTEMTAALAASGSSVPQRLDELAQRHGRHATRQWSTRFLGLDGPAVMAERVNALRQSPPTALAGIALTEVEDLAPGGRLPPTDAIILRGDGLRVVVRPSGTEPKLKAYVEVIVDAAQDPSARIDAVIEELAALLG